MCSPQDLPFLNPACSLRSIGSRAVDILFRITLLNTLLVTDNSVIPPTVGTVTKNIFLSCSVEEL